MDDQVPFNTTFNTTFNSSSNSTNGTFEGFQPPSPPKSFWTNLLLPTLYLIIVIGSLYTFSTLYRKRQVAKTASLEPWFPAHRQRDIYFSLLHLDPAEAGGEDDEKKLKRVPDSILKAALMQRALEDIRRIVQLRTSKQALQTLLQRGSVGDELWQRFQRAEQEMEAEVKDVVNEVSEAAKANIAAIRALKRILTYFAILGQRIRTKLGSSNLSVRERDEPEHHH